MKDNIKLRSRIGNAKLKVILRSKYLYKKLYRPQKVYKYLNYYLMFLHFIINFPYKIKNENKQFLFILR